jgi:hypothetical protein
MTREEEAFCDYINAGLKDRGLDAHFGYVKRERRGFDFDLVKNIHDERYLDVFDGLAVSGWLRFQQSKAA